MYKKEEKESLDHAGNRWGVIFLIVAICSGWGCAPTMVNRMGPVVRPPLGGYKEVVIGQFQGAKLSQASQQNFTYKVQGKLMEMGAFRSVRLASSNSKPNPSQVTLTGTITEFSEGNRFAQWFIGFGAGASEVSGAFKVTDPKGKPLYQFSASTTYAGGMGIGGAPLLSMDDLLENLASSVAEETTKWARGDPLEGEGESEFQVAEASYTAREVPQGTGMPSQSPAVALAPKVQQEAGKLSQNVETVLAVKPPVNKVDWSWVKAPDYKDGEWWVFQSKVTNRPSSKNLVTFKGGEFDNTGPIPLASANLPAVYLKDSKKKPLDFPLVKGKKWSYRYLWESPRSGREYWRAVDAEVIGPASDPLKTAAGEFKVIEIRRTDTTSFNTRNAETKYTYFYSAETKSIVKIIQDWERRDGSPIHKEKELIEYSVRK